MDQAPKLEVKKPIENVHDLLNLSPEEKEILKKRVEQWGGLVRIFVHPLFEKWRDGEYETYESYIRDENIEIEKTLSRILAIDKGKVPPLIIMQEKKFMSEFKKWLKTIRKPSQETVYFVKTFSTNPAPSIEGKERSDVGEAHTIPSWKNLKDTLKEIGVKKIFLGGTKFEMSEYEKDWTDKDPFMGGCVGIAMSVLSKDKGGEFEVELSPLTAPFRERRNFADFQRKNKE